MENNAEKEFVIGLDVLAKHKNLFERIGIYMPQYYPPPENWKNRGKIKITYIPKWRNFWLLKHLPLWVGDKVKFRFQSDNAGENNPYALHVIHEIIDGVVVNETNIEKIDVEITGLFISTEGNLKFSFGVVNYAHPTDSLIVTANIQNKDRWWLGCAGFILGLLSAIISGVIVSFIIVDPAWHVWIPEWIMKLLR